MKLPAAAYSAEVATSATKAGSYRVCGEGESTERESHLGWMTTFAGHRRSRAVCNPGQKSKEPSDSEELSLGWV